MSAYGLVFFLHTYLSAKINLYARMFHFFWRREFVRMPADEGAR